MMKTLDVLSSEVLVIGDSERFRMVNSSSLLRHHTALCKPPADIQPVSKASFFESLDRGRMLFLSADV